MEFNKCSRCGSFYISQGDVCPKCIAKDANDKSNFRNYIEENGFSNLETISGKTGITIRNLNRYLEYEEFQEYKNNIENNNNIAEINNIY